MDTNRLIPFAKRCQIITALERAAPYNGELWQTTEQGRQVLLIVQMVVDIKIDKLVIRCLGMLDIDTASPIYVRLSYRSIIFRLNPGQYRIFGDRIICDYPLEAAGLPERRNERYALPYDSEISLSLKRNIRSLRETVFELEVRIMDVSESGFGVIISGNNRDYIRQLDNCWIRAVDQKSMTTPILSRVRYVAPKGYFLKRGEVRVGLALERALNEETFENLKKRAYLVLSA